MTTRRRFTGEFKAEVALEALRGDKTIRLPFVSRTTPHVREETTSALYSSTKGETSSGPMPKALARYSPYWNSCCHSHSSM